MRNMFTMCTIMCSEITPTELNIEMHTFQEDTQK